MAIYYVTDSPFGAKGNGITNDRSAIQAAIDKANFDGGGTVVLTANTTFLSTPLVLKSNVTLHFEDGAVLLQSDNDAEYSVFDNGVYKTRIPHKGHNNYDNSIQWNHSWYANIPFIFAGEGTSNVKITGNGTISMSTLPCADAIHCCPIGFYRVTDFEITDISIKNYHAYAIALFTTKRGFVARIKISDYLCWNTDGISVMNSSDIRFTECDINSGDDSLYFFSSYDDARAHQEGAWWSSAEPEPICNIEVDHCKLVSRGCKGFAMILWGNSSPDKEKTEIRDIYVHDNYIASIGIWHSERKHPAVTDIHFENNDIEVVEYNFLTTRIAGLKGFPSVQCIMNEEFVNGKCFWTLKGNAGVCRDFERYGFPYGHVAAGEGRNSLTQGNYIRSDMFYVITADVRVMGVDFNIVVRNLDTDELEASMPLALCDWKSVEFTFKVRRAGNYYVGIEAGENALGEVHMKKMTCFQETIWRV